MAVQRDRPYLGYNFTLDLGTGAGGWGRIIFVTTVGVKVVQPNMVLCDSVRLAVVGLDKSLSIEFAHEGIVAAFFVGNTIVQPLSLPVFTLPVGLKVRNPPL